MTERPQKKSAGQAATPLKRIVPHGGDGAGNGDAGQGEALIEGPGSDAGDGQAVDAAREGHRAAGTGVRRDGDSPVIGGVSELGWRRSGKRQEQEHRGQPGSPGRGHTRGGF